MVAYMSMLFPPPHTQNRVTRNCFLKTALLVFATFIILFSFVGSVSASGSGYVGISPLSAPMIVPGGLAPIPATDWTDIENAVLAASGDVLIEVMNDIIIAGNAIVIPSGVHVFLRSDPSSPSTYSIFQDTGWGRHFTVTGGHLSIEDIQLTRTIPTGLSIDGGGIEVWGSGQLEMFTGSVISGNEALWAGGGGVVIIDGSSFTMHDGTISYNEALYGGGVYINSSSTFIMRGGIISNNKDVGGLNGGGVRAINSTFIMFNGEISGNEASWGGGGIYISGSTFTMHNGSISNNVAGYGGGIEMDNLHGSTSFTMHGGEISNNVVITEGGGIWAAESTVDILGGKIVNNVAGTVGGGVAIGPYTDLTTTANVIFMGNTANSPHDWYLHSDFLTGIVPPGDSGFGGLGGGSIANIDWASTSIAGAHLLNNYDINFAGAPIMYQVVTFDPNGGSFADTALSQIQADGQSQWRWISQVADTGVMAPTYALAFNTAGNLQNLPLPHPTKSGYVFGGWFNSEAEANDLTSQDSRVQSTDSVTNDASRTLWARWTPAPTGGGGGSPTGNATILDPPIIRPPPVIPEIPEPPVIPELPEPEIPVTVILLSIIGIAVFAYRRVEEAKEKENP